MKTHAIYPQKKKERERKRNFRVSFAFAFWSLFFKFLVLLQRSISDEFDNQTSNKETHSLIKRKESIVLCLSYLSFICTY